MSDDDVRRRLRRGAIREAVVWLPGVASAVWLLSSGYSVLVSLVSLFVVSAASGLAASAAGLIHLEHDDEP